MTPSSSAMDWFVLCSVHDTRNIFQQHLFSYAYMRFVMFLFRVQAIPRVVGHGQLKQNVRPSSKWTGQNTEVKGDTITMTYIV